MNAVEREIRETPQALEKTLEYSKKVFESFEEDLRSFFSRTVYFVGCGSSYYLSLAASKYFTKELGIETKAFPAGEILFSEDENVGKGKKSVVLISRSGETTEVIKAGEKFKEMGVETIGISLEPKSSLSKVSDLFFPIPIEEKEIVMTKSFTSMLIFFEIIATLLSGKDGSVFENLVERSKNVLEESFRIIEREKLHEMKHYVFLGLGVYEGIAREAALKLEEMSISTVEAYSALDYRHGPKALVEDGVLVVLYTRGIDEEKKLKEELEGYGGKVITVGVEGSDLYVSNLIPEDAFLRAIFAQVLGLKRAEFKGLDVEKPRNLTKVVKLE